MPCPNEMNWTKASTAAYINHSLNEQGISTLHFAGGNMNPSTRQHNLNMFMNEDDCNVLACTDLVSRGTQWQK